MARARKCTMAELAEFAALTGLDNTLIEAELDPYGEYYEEYETDCLEEWRSMARRFVALTAKERRALLNLLAGRGEPTRGTLRSIIAKMEIDKDFDPRVTEAWEQLLPDPHEPGDARSPRSPESPRSPKRGSPSVRRSTSRPPTQASKEAVTFVSLQERIAVAKALDEAGKPLVMWKISESSKIGQPRIEGGGAELPDTPNA